MSYAGIQNVFLLLLSKNNIRTFWKLIYSEKLSNRIRVSNKNEYYCVGIKKSRTVVEKME